MEHPWEGYQPPFRIWGNLYFVGTRPASTHIIATGDGLILLDPGYPQSLYLVIDGIYRLGYDPRDIKIILHSHGHYDHLGATKALVSLTGAKTYLGAEDELYSNGTLDLTWARELGNVYLEAFEPDVLIHDGDHIKLGNTDILCLHTPGHTPGTYSFFFDATDGHQTRRCGTFGGAGINSMELEFLDKYSLSYTCRADFIHSIDRLLCEDINIFIGNHAYQNHTPEKYLHMVETGENLFLDTDGEWKEFLSNRRSAMLKKIEKETPELLSLL